MATETQKLNEVHISTYCKTTSPHYLTYCKNTGSQHSRVGYIVRISIPGTPSIVREHRYSTAQEAGEAIHGLKEFYTYFGI